MVNIKNSSNVTAVIPAAGLSSRMNGAGNKLLLKINGMPVLARTIQAFENCSMINSIILVVKDRDILYCRKEIVQKYKFTKIKSIIKGGDTRAQSVFNGLIKAAGCDIAVIHDGARPFVSESIIENCIEAAYENRAACAAVPVKDTIKKTKGGMIINTPDRDNLYAAQTPQAFEYDLIYDAYKKSADDNFFAVDDCSVVERTGIKPKIVMGSYSNIKITTKEDLLYSTVIMQKH